MNVVSDQSLPYIFSSDPRADPAFLSADGTEFDVSLYNPIQLPSNAFDCTVEVVKATIWNTVNNIAASLNNNIFSVFYSGSLRTITITDGSYSVQALNSLVSKELVNLGLPSDVVVITGDVATQRINLTFPYIGSYVDFTVPDSCYEILGFGVDVYPAAPTTVVNQNIVAPNVAAFNNIERFLIKSTIVSESIPTNQNKNQTIASIPIPPGSVGSQFTFEPRYPVKLDASDLKNPKQNINFRLTNELGEPAITNEAFSCELVIRYKTLIKNPVY